MTNRNYLITPDLTAYTREFAESGILLTVLKRFWELSFLNKIYLIIGSFVKTPKLLLKDFNQGILLLIEMEVMKRKQKVNTVIMSNQLTDLMLASQNEKIFLDFLSLCSKYNLKSGLHTNNFGLLFPLLDNLIHEFDVIITPINKSGALMYPNKQTVLKLIKEKKIQSKIVSL